MITAKNTLLIANTTLKKSYEKQIILFEFTANNTNSATNPKWYYSGISLFAHI
jgi:hypothetical protein